MGCILTGKEGVEEVEGVEVVEVVEVVEGGCKLYYPHPISVIYIIYKFYDFAYNIDIQTFTN